MKLNLQDKFNSHEKMEITWFCEKDENGNLIIKENKAILGIIKGVFFVPNGKSRNRRFYPLELWEKILSDPKIQYRLKNKLMFGMIGHHQEPVNEDNLNKGEVSHIVTELWINENEEGIGTAVIINTPAGRNLATYYNAGSKLKFSSRASGGYVEGAYFEGLPVVNKDDFELDTFDVVLEPGFLEAEPEFIPTNKTDFKENISFTKNKENNIIENDKKGEKMFTEEQLKQIKKIMSESFNASSQINEKNDLNEKMNNLILENRELRKDFQDLTESVMFLESIDDATLGVIKDLAKNNKAHYIKEWNNIAEPYRLTEAINKMEAHSDVYSKYLELGTPEEISEMVETFERKLPVLNKLEELNIDVEDLEAMTTMVEMLENFHENYGTLEEVSKVLNETENTLRVIEMEKIRNRNKLVEKKAREISNEFGIALEESKKYLKKLGEKETVKLLEKLKQDKPNFNKPSFGNDLNESNSNQKKSLWNFMYVNKKI